MLKFKTSCAVLANLSSNLLNEVGLSLFRYFEVGLRVCDIVVNKFTFAISSPDEFLLYFVCIFMYLLCYRIFVVKIKVSIDTKNCHSIILRIAIASSGKMQSFCRLLTAVCVEITVWYLYSASLTFLLSYDMISWKSLAYAEKLMDSQLNLPHKTTNRKILKKNEKQQRRLA